MLRHVLMCSALAAGLVGPAMGQTPNPPDPAQMSRQELRDEVVRLRAITQNGAVSPSRPAGCTAAESRQFDFWLGEWDVSPSGSTSGVIVAESSIALADQGCVIVEEWRPFAGASGHSLNLYDAAENRWRQTWMDASGRRTEYAGTLDAEGVLRLDDVSGPGAQAGSRGRMNFQRIDGDTVRQWGENFDAESGQWAVSWDFTYRRRAGTR